MHLSHLAISFALISSIAVPQVDTIPRDYVASPLDSGPRDDRGGNHPAYRADAQVPGATWLRLDFDATDLAEGSRLHLTSALDGATQHFDAQSLADYGMSSAYFNGDRVRVELWPGRGTRANRVVVPRIEYGLRNVATESICFNTDDQQLATDPRIGRGVSGASACTWWLVNEFTLLTAGHCAASTQSTGIIGFNIPLSLPDGTYVHPSPDDQYPIDLATLRYQNSGRGADWAVIAAGRNSNHGMYPGQRQGAWFELGPVPTAPTGVDIRITGNGRVTAPVSMTWNAVTKTHVGPLVSTTISDAIAYQTDTTGGNSGSPVIHEQTGLAVGIHTHGGCNASGNRNYGTRIDRTNLAAAIQAVLASKLAGGFETFGVGCGGPGGAPTLTFQGIPDRGANFAVELAGLSATQAGALLVGLSNTAWAGLGLPLDLGPLLGTLGCNLYTSIDTTAPLVTNSSGSARLDLPLTNDPGTVGRRLYFQFVSPDPISGSAWSNGGGVLIGG